MAATVSLSDLAAVGAQPLGLLISVALPAQDAEHYQAGVARGIEAACRECGTQVLGGDTSFDSQQLMITVAAAGLVPRDQVMMRTGCRSGDLVYSTGLLGGGSILAAHSLSPLSADLLAEAVLPRARIREAQALRGFARSCMDSSDGLIATLDQMLRLNKIGFELTKPVTEILHPSALHLSEALKVDPYLMIAQPHGEFELIFTIASADRDRFEAGAAKQSLVPVLLGEVIDQPVIRLSDRKGLVVDAAAIRNLLGEVKGNPARYWRELTGLWKR